ncbi:hypothetical protein [Pseudofulvimonas gallinarii]|uniref:hypothetical protein n=1 Tax=Pseudofulvimonas gallinarii TaxID=634155 RepID=UPI0035EFF9F3
MPATGVTATWLPGLADAAIHTIPRSLVAEPAWLPAAVRDGIGRVAKTVGADRPAALR